MLRFLQKHEDHADVFAYYAQLLKQLEQSTENTEQLLRRFEVNLLHSIGYGLQLTHDAKSMLPVEPEKKYTYEIEQGPVEIVISTSQNGAKPVISGHTLLALHQATLLNQQQLKESKDLMRFVIKDLLGGYNFKSREFFTTKF